MMLNIKIFSSSEQNVEMAVNDFLDTYDVVIQSISTCVTWRPDVSGYREGVEIVVVTVVYEVKE